MAVMLHGRNNGNILHDAIRMNISCHATWLPCKTSQREGLGLAAVSDLKPERSWREACNAPINVIRQKEGGETFQLT